MNELRANVEQYTNGVTDSSFLSLLTSYLPLPMFTTGIIFLTLAIVLTVTSNVAMVTGHKKLGVLLLLVSTCFIAFLTYANYKEKTYVDKSQSIFEQVYNQTIHDATGAEKAVLNNTKMYAERYKSTPTTDNRIRYSTAFDSMLYKMKELKAMKAEQVDGLNNVLRSHVAYVTNYEKLINTIQLYLVVCLIFLTIFRIDFKTKKALTV